MEHSKPNSWDKAMDSWHDAKIRYGNAWPYLKKAAEEIVYQAIWLGSLMLLTKALKPSNTALNQNSSLNLSSNSFEDTSKIDQPDLTSNLPVETQRVVSLSKTINSENLIVKPILASILYTFGKDPQNGKKIVEKSWYAIQNCAAGTWDLIKVGYHLTNYYIWAEPEIAQDAKTEDLLPCNGEGGEEVEAHQ